MGCRGRPDDVSLDGGSIVVLVHIAVFTKDFGAIFAVYKVY